MLAATLVDSSVFTISNATFNGAADAAQIVTLAGSDHFLAQQFPVSVVLSTGNASLAALDVNTLPSSSTSNGQPGTSLINGTTFDAAILSFTLTPLASGNLSFTYVFASEEYPEYVGSQFNDAFRLLVNGTVHIPEG